MGVYIKGMEMPTRCADCKMYVEDIYYCPLIHREIENPWADDGVELDCPIVPVPPHGRLIDADALINDMANMIPWAIESPEEIAMVDGLSAGYEAVKDAPTIIPAEEGET